MPWSSWCEQYGRSSLVGVGLSPVRIASISRVFFHHGFKYNLIQPVTLKRSIVDGSPLSPPLAPHIQPQYYAAIIAAEAIGNSGNTQVIELNITDTRISGYAFYQSGQLKKMVIIDSLAFFKTSTKPRPSTHVNLTFFLEIILFLCR